MKIRFYAATMAVALPAATSNAAVINGAVTDGTAFASGKSYSHSFNNGGTFVELDPSTGFTVGKNNFNVNILYAFDEDQNITLT